MPILQKAFTLSVTPEQFLAACSISELFEVEMLLNSRFRDEMNEAMDEVHKSELGQEYQQQPVTT